MPQRVTLKLGFQKDLRDVTLVIPDDEPRPWQWGDDLALVGQPTPRIDGPAKATGAARYTYDVKLPGMLHGAILRSPYPHARVRGIDLSAAEKLAGVRAAIKRPDAVMRFAGQEVAAVAAIDLNTARDAIALIKVDYEPLPFVAEMERAQRPGAPRVFADGVAIVSNEAPPKSAERGDLARGLEQAAVTHEAIYTTQAQTHVSLETHGAVASWDGDQLTVWCSTQGIFTVRDDLADFFKLPGNGAGEAESGQSGADSATHRSRGQNGGAGESASRGQSRVRVITDYLGGGFGSKLGLGPEVVIAVQLARAAGAPVKVMLPRAAEHLATGNRPNSKQRVKIAGDAAGNLTALTLLQYGSGGIGGGAGSAGPYWTIYRCANLKTVERNVYINAGPSSPMRAPGWPQGCFALEVAIDELANKLGIERLTMRRRNNPNPVRDLEYDIGARAFEWEHKRARGRSKGPYRRGIGVASAAWHGIGAAGPQAQVIAYRDGHAELRIGAQDIGTGTRTILAMVAAEELGLPLAQVTAAIGDTRYPYSVPSGGSMTAPSDSPAVRQAAAHLKQKLLRIAAPLLGSKIDDLEMRAGVIWMRSNTARAISFPDLCRRLPGDSLMAEGEHVPGYDGYRTDQAGCQFAEVEVDIETGIVRVIEVVAVHDAGRIIDPLTARSQVNGGVIMGIGFALFEERRIDPAIGLMVNPTMDDYKLPGALDIPEIKVMFVEVANGITNTGVIGLGEASHVATAAAIGCAVYDAIGVPVRALPMTPDRVLAALGKNA
jgi:xanthine dehydrogenase YagR molybdenum-binding subunit